MQGSMIPGSSDDRSTKMPSMHITLSPSSARLVAGHAAAKHEWLGNTLFPKVP